jgi:hypothetical protein
MAPEKSGEVSGVTPDFYGTRFKLGKAGTCSTTNIWTRKPDPTEFSQDPL